MSPVKNIHIDIIAPNSTIFYRRIFKILKFCFSWMAHKKNEIIEESYYTLILWFVRFGREHQILPIFFPNKAFHFFTSIKLIYTLVYISIFEQLFLSPFPEIWIFRCEQSYYRNIGYFEGIYTCENLACHLQTEKKI